MRRYVPRTLLVALSGVLLLAAGAGAVQAQAAKGASGLPLPRFVSLKAKSINVRVGPSLDYAIAWRYLKSGLPVEIIQEYDNWRRIRDAEGTEGWVNQALLSGERTAVAAPWMRGKGEDVFVNMRSEAQSNSTIVARVEPGAVVRVGQCTGEWCQVSTKGIEGWMAQSEMWGAYPGEAFK